MTEPLVIDAVTHLTPREVDVLRVMVESECQYDAAKRMGISPETVKGHLSHVYGKLGTSGLIATCRRLGWLKVPS